MVNVLIGLYLSSHVSVSSITRRCTITTDIPMYLNYICIRTSRRSVSIAGNAFSYGTRRVHYVPRNLEALRDMGGPWHSDHLTSMNCSTYVVSRS